MSKWLYTTIKEYNPLTDFPQGTYGFIYISVHIPTNKSYLGKKSLYHNVKKKLGKKELAEQPITRGRTSTTKQIIKESDWKTYYGSAKPILELIKLGKQKDFDRKILYIVSNKKLLTYYECKYLFQLGVLENPNDWINDNILGKFFRKDFVSQD
jgi:hypothetical protein